MYTKTAFCVSVDAEIPKRPKQKMENRKSISNAFMTNSHAFVFSAEVHTVEQLFGRTVV